MKRKHKIYSRPKRPFEKARILEENEIRKKYGLKNKREIWKAEAKIKTIRGKAKVLISSTPEKQQELFDRLKTVGLKVNSIADVLALQKEDYLQRRLQTILVEKKIATTPKGARQLIVHKKVFVDGKIVNIPSFVVPVRLENRISLKPSKIKIKKIGETNE